MKLKDNTVIEQNEKRNYRHPLEEVVPLSTPYIIYLDPSGACNFKCNFCPCNTVDYMNAERHKIMDWGLFVKTVEQIQEFPEQVKVIDMYANGEPLLNKRLPDMIKYLKDNNICREVRITTNGSLLNPDINKSLVDAGIDLVRISVESLYDDDYKEMCGVDLKFSELVQNIADLYDRCGDKTKVSIKIITAAFKNDDDVLRFQEIFEPISHYRYIQRLLKNMWGEFDDVVVTSGESTYVTSENVVKEGWRICAMPLTMMTVHANGAIGVCPQDWKFGTQYGAVQTDGLVAAWNSLKLKNMRIKHLQGKRHEIPYCKDCICVADDNIDNVADLIINRLI